MAGVVPDIDLPLDLERLSMISLYAVFFVRPSQLGRREGRSEGNPGEALEDAAP